jgi:hypothetical protein
MNQLPTTAARYGIAIAIAIVTGVGVTALSTRSGSPKPHSQNVPGRAVASNSISIAREAEAGDSTFVDYREQRTSRYPRAPLEHAREMVNASVAKNSPPQDGPQLKGPQLKGPQPQSAQPKAPEPAPSAPENAPAREQAVVVPPRVAPAPARPPLAVGKAPVRKETPVFEVAQADKESPPTSAPEESFDAPRPADPEPTESQVAPPPVEPQEVEEAKETLPRPPAPPSRNRRLPPVLPGSSVPPMPNRAVSPGSESDAVPGTGTPFFPQPPGFLPGQPSAIGPLPVGPGGESTLRGAPALPAPVWAEKPKLGDHWPTCDPKVDCAANLIETQEGDFSNDPFIDAPYDECEQGLPYYGKRPVQRAQPFWLFGRSFYDYGPYAPAPTFFGRSNLLLPQFMGFGDVRVGMASNRNTVNDFNVVATTINLDMDLRLTSTERLHAFATPFARNGSFTRYNFGNNGSDFTGEGNFNLLAGYFEGDMGAIVGGMTNYVLPFDLPFAVGGMPLVFQNGVWMEDIVTGAAVTIPARNSPLLAISNMDVTFFTAWDGITTPAVQGNNSAASIYGVGSWVEAWGGYLEFDYAFLDDRSLVDRSYHNIGVGWTRRYGKWLSNSVRWIGNVGQDPTGIDRTAHGSIVLIENSLITRQPSNWVPYFNLWGGFGRPQSLARAGTAGGILRNTGILFESDNLTGYPTLDPSGQNTYGAALGINILKLDFSQQLILETAVLQTMGGVNSRLAQGEEYGLGVRYQRNLTNASLIRLDGMYGFLPDGPRDIAGGRVEWRMKF